MTLNITIVSPAGIHQSADFQISKTERDVDGNWVELQPNSSKIVCLQYEKWSGFVTYCGIGLWNGKRIDEYAAEWLASLPHSGTTFRDAVERIRDRGTTLIASVRKSLGEIVPHSFVLAGYERGVPVYAVISNYQSLTGDIRPISEQLRADVRSTTGTHVFVTGIRSAVSPERKHRLKHLARSGTDANVIRHELAEANRLAAQSQEAKKGISASCLTHSMDSNGGGHGEVHGDVPGPLMPRTIMNGVDLNKLLSQLLKAIPNAKFVQSAIATGRSNEAAARERIDCNPRVSSARAEPDSPEFATLEEVGEINDYHLSIHGLSNKKCLVGQMRNPAGGPPRAFVWPEGQGIRDLGTFGGPFSNALSANDSAQVVGTAHVDGSATHAFLWEECEGMRDLGTLGGRDSIARSINNRCQVVGESFVGEGDPKREGQRAFLWMPNGGMIDLGNQFEGSSIAYAINDGGVVLGWRLVGATICGFIWSPELGTVDIVGAGGRNFYPCAINDTGLVVGEGDDCFGKRRAFCWTLEGGLRQLDAPDDFHPCGVDPHGNVVGNVHSRPWNRPYLYSTIRDECLPLPFIEDHHTSVKAINGSGVVVGAAQKGSWKHSHPLIWHLSLR